MKKTILDEKEHINNEYFGSKSVIHFKMKNEATFRFVYLHLILFFSAKKILNLNLNK